MSRSMTTVEMLHRLVAFDTTSRVSNRPLVEFVAGYLADHSVTPRLLGEDPSGKVNLWATIGPEGEDGVILSAHTDCVPVDDQRWSSEPFRVAESGGRLYGRGAADMKGFLAAALSAVPRFVEAGLRRPVHLALSYDEEVGGGGARAMVRDLAGSGAVGKARWCVVGEPTSMQVVTSHKGIYTYQATVSGREAHSSLAPRVVNAAVYGARLVAALAREAGEKQESGPFDDGFDVSHTTIHTGVIRAGTALNIVPAHAEVEFEFRHLPADPAEVIHGRIMQIVDGLHAEMAEGDPESGIEVAVKAHLPALDTDPNAAVVAEVQRLTSTPGLGKVAYATEAGLFAEDLQIPTVLCGPGSIEQAHKPDEYVEIDQLAAADEFMERLAARLAAD